MIIAEKRCRKFKCGATDWSPQYQKIHNLIDYWLLRRRYQQGLRPNMKLVKRLGTKLHIAYKTITLKQISTELDKAHEKRRQFKAQATSHSLEYRNQLAKAKEEAGDKKASTYLKELNEKEAIQKLFHMIKIVEDRIKAGALSQISITEPDGSTKVLTLQKAIETAIIGVNRENIIKPKALANSLRMTLLNSWDITAKALQWRIY